MFTCTMSVAARKTEAYRIGWLDSTTLRMSKIVVSVDTFDTFYGNILQFIYILWRWH